MVQSQGCDQLGTDGILMEGGMVCHGRERPQFFGCGQVVGGVARSQWEWFGVMRV